MFFLAVSSLIFYTATVAQVAVMDSKKVLASIPQVLKADTLAAQEQERLNDEYNQLRAKTQAQLSLADSLYKLSPRDSATLRVVAASQKLSQQLQAYPQYANKKLGDYRNVLFTPYIDRVNSAVKIVAQRLKYKQVMDVQAVPFAWFDKATDITDLVIAELNKK